MPNQKDARGRAPKEHPTAGVREVKAHLSAYLRRVRAGETVAITDRGQVIAQLAPPPAPSTAEMMEQVLTDLARAGKIVRPTLTTEQLRRANQRLRTAKPAVPVGTVQKILDEDREERF